VTLGIRVLFATRTRTLAFGYRRYSRLALATAGLLVFNGLAFCVFFAKNSKLFSKLIFGMTSSEIQWNVDLAGRQKPHGNGI